ncbi:hypothetical protein D3C72_1215040 [compost metagenome]
MHAGGHLNGVHREMVFGIHHLPVIVGLQGAAFQLCITVGQPQGRIDHMQIIIQQRKAQIVRANAVGAMLIHTQRCRRAKPGFEILIQRREPAIEPDHQRQIFARRQLNQTLGVMHILGQRFIDANVNTGIEQFAHHLIVRRGRGMNEYRVTVARQIRHGGSIRNSPGVADSLRFFPRRGPCGLQRPVGRRAQNRQPGFLRDPAEADHANA